MIITISGHPGSGKGTVGKMLAKKLGYKYFSIGEIRREMARERGMTLQEFNVLGEKQAFTDTDVDRWQAKLGKTKDNLIVEGRTSFHFIPHSIKLFFATDLHVAAKRIFHDHAYTRQFEASKHYTSPKQLAHGLRHRIASDTRRYQKYYGLNIFQKRHYDLWIDTSKQTPEDTLHTILQYLANPVRRRKALARPKSKYTRVNTLTKKNPVRSTSNGAKVSQKKNNGERLGRKAPVLHKKTTKKATRQQLQNKAKVSQKKRK